MYGYVHRNHLTWPGPNHKSCLRNRRGSNNASSHPRCRRQIWHEPWIASEQHNFRNKDLQRLVMPSFEHNSSFFFHFNKNNFKNSSAKFVNCNFFQHFVYIHVLYKISNVLYRKTETLEYMRVRKNRNRNTRKCGLTRLIDTK